MWAMKLWDEGYKRVSREMLGDRPQDDHQLVRGGSAGLAEVGKRGINMQGLSRSIANLVAPMPAQPLKSDQQDADTVYSGNDTSNGISNIEDSGLTGLPRPSFEEGTVVKVDHVRPSSPSPILAGLETLPQGDNSDTDGLPGDLLDKHRCLARSITSPPAQTTFLEAEESASPREQLRTISQRAVLQHSRPSSAPTAGQLEPRAPEPIMLAPELHGTQEPHLLQSESLETLSTARESCEAPLQYADGECSLNLQVHRTGEPGPSASDQPYATRAKHSTRVMLRVVSPSDPEGQMVDLEAPRMDQCRLSCSIVDGRTAALQAQNPQHVEQISPSPSELRDAQLHPSQELSLPARPQEICLHHQSNWGSPLATCQTPFQPGSSPAIHNHNQIQQQDPRYQPTPVPQVIAQPAAKEIDLLMDITWGNIVGEGGFGKVYAATFQGQKVAVKVAGREDCCKATVVNDFQREVLTMEKLPSHRHVLGMIAACTKPPRLALVTEFCSRGSMYSLLHDPSAHLTWAQIIYMCLGAAQGMAHLHRHNVLHRDLKSANLLVDQDYSVKVADFGLSRVQSDLATMTGGLGTYQWMAPEVLGYQRYTDKADVYSFGIVLWECTAREIPYAGMQGMPAAMAVMNRGLRPEIPAHTPSPLADLIRACWRPIPSERPTMQEAAATLSHMYRTIQANGNGLNSQNIYQTQKHGSNTT